jgi:hypothetical protein
MCIKSGGCRGRDRLVVCFTTICFVFGFGQLNATFKDNYVISYIISGSFIDGANMRKPLTCRKLLTNLIT